MTIWNAKTYIIKQKVLTIGRKYYIETGSGKRIGFCKQKMFKWKEDIRVYTGEDMSAELLNIKQEQVLDFSGTFTVQDKNSGEHVGFVGRKGMASLFKDTWKIFDKNRNVICTVEEEGGALAILRRLIGILKMIPKNYHFTHNGSEIATASQRFQIIGDTWTLRIKGDSGVDTRLIVTAALMMDIVEQQRGH